MMWPCLWGRGQRRNNATCWLCSSPFPSLPTSGFWPFRGWFADGWFVSGLSQGLSCDPESFSHCHNYPQTFTSSGFDPLVPSLKPWVLWSVSLPNGSSQLISPRIPPATFLAVCSFHLGYLSPPLLPVCSGSAHVLICQRFGESSPSSGHNGDIGRNTPLPPTTKRTTTNLKPKNNQKHQILKLHGNPTTKEFKSIFVYAVSSLVSFFCLWLSSFHNSIYWRNFLFFIVCFWLLCQKLVVHMCGFISELPFMVYWSMCLFFCHCQTVLIK